MISKTFTYTDYNGTERTETAYFNLSKAEIMEMEMSVDGGFTAMIDRIVQAKDAPSLVQVFKDLILRSYGVKSPDGRRFVKSEELRNEFAQTEMYSELFMELSTDDVKAAEFINGLIPKDLADKIKNDSAQTNISVVN